MSKDNLTEKDKELANAIVGIYKNVEDTYNNYVKKEDKDNG